MKKSEISDDQMSVSQSQADGSSVKAEDLTSSEDDSKDEVDQAKFDRKTSSRFISQSSRRMSLAQSHRYSIKSQKFNLEAIRKNQMLLEEAKNTNFEQAAEREKLSFFQLARTVRNHISESIILAQLKKEKSKMRRYDTINGIFSLILICLYIVEYEIFLSDAGKQKFASNFWNHILRSTMLILSSFVCVLQYFHYSVLLNIQKILKLKDKRETIRTSGFLKYLIFECIFNSMICPPLVDVKFRVAQLNGHIHLSLDTICCFLCLLRFYNVLKVPEQYSLWTTEESTKVCKKYKFSPDISFLIRAELKRRPYLMVFASLFATMVLFGLGVRIFERCYEDKFGSFDPYFSQYVDTFWFIIVTMVTVGYGDRYPLTHMGRFLALWVGVVGTLLVSLMLVALSSTTQLSNGEQRVFSRVDIISLRSKAKQYGSELLFNIFTMYVSNKRIIMLEQDEDEQQEVNREVFKKFALLSRTRNIAHEFNLVFFKYSTSTSIPEDLILDLYEKNDEKFKTVYSTLGKVSFIQENCMKVTKNQAEILEKMNEIVSGQHRIAAFLVKVNLNFHTTAV